MEIRDLLRSTHSSGRNRITIEKLLQYNYKKSKAKLLKRSEKPEHYRSHQQISDSSELSISNPYYFTTHAHSRQIPHRQEPPGGCLPEKPSPKFDYLRKRNWEDRIQKTGLVNRIKGQKPEPVLIQTQFKQPQAFLKKKDRPSHPLCALFRIKCDFCKCPLDCYNTEFQRMLACKDQEISHPSQKQKELDQGLKKKVTEIVVQAARKRGAHPDIVNSAHTPHQINQIEQQCMRDKISGELANEINDESIKEYQQWAKSLYKMISKSIQEIPHESRAEFADSSTNTSHQKISSSHQLARAGNGNHDSIKEKTDLKAWAASKNSNSMNSIIKTLMSRKKPNQTLHLPARPKQNIDPSQGKKSRSRNITPDHRSTEHRSTNHRNRRTDNKTRKVYFRKGASNGMQRIFNKKDKVKDKEPEEVKMMTGEQEEPEHSCRVLAHRRFAKCQQDNALNPDLIHEDEQSPVKNSMRRSSRELTRKRSWKRNSSFLGNPFPTKEEGSFHADADEQDTDPAAVDDLTFEDLEEVQRFQVRTRKARRLAMISDLSHCHFQKTHRGKDCLDFLLLPQNTNEGIKQQQFSVSSETEKMQQVWISMMKEKLSIERIGEMNEAELSELKRMYADIQNNIQLIAKVNAILEQHNLQALIPRINDSFLTVVRKLKRIEKVNSSYKSDDSESIMGMLKKYGQLVEDNLRIRMNIKGKSKAVETSKQSTEQANMLEEDAVDRETLTALLSKYASLEGVKFFDLFTCESDGEILNCSGLGPEDGDKFQKQLKLTTQDIVTGYPHICVEYQRKIESYTSHQEKTPFDFFHYKFMVETIIARKLSGGHEQFCHGLSPKPDDNRLSYLRTLNQINMPSGTHVDADCNENQSNKARQLYGLKCQQVLQQKSMNDHCHFEQ